MARKALGKGLEALIPGAGSAGERRSAPPEWVDPGRVQPNPRQPRMEFEGGELDALTASVREVGILQPLLVRRVEGGFELIAGERRLRAAKKAGLERVPVVVRDATEEESLALALVENLQRMDLSPLEEAAGYEELMGKFGMTQEEVAGRVGKSRSAVANALRLLSLPEKVKEELGSGSLSAGHARVLVGLEDPEQQLRAARQIINRGLSVRDAERQFRSVRTRERRRPKEGELEMMALARRLSERLGTRVRIKGSAGKGKIEVEYYTPEQLRELAEQIEGGRL